MKLYSVDLSPFAARVRMAIYAKGLDIQIVPLPGGGLKSPEYLAINPMGKIPTLELDDGTGLPESETIVEYLEDKFPSPSLRGDSAEALAQGRLVARLVDLYVTPHLQALFGQLDPKTRDQAVADQALGKLEDGLGHVERRLDDGGYAAGSHLSTADCLIAPMLFFLPVVGRPLGRDLLAANPKLAAYVAKMQTEPVFQRVADEMGRALKALRAGG